MTIIAQMERARIAIEGALSNPSILKQLALYGYDRKKLMEGKAYYEKMRLLENTKNQERGEQLRNTDELYAAFDQAYKQYIKHVKIARMAIPHNRELWRILDLSGTRKRNIAGWLYQAEAFYMNIGQVEGALAHFGVTSEELAQAKAMMEAVAAARVKRFGSASDAQLAKKERDDALTALNDWYRKFIVIARVALDQNPQMLEALGLMVRS